MAMDVEEAASQLATALAADGRPERAAAEAAYLKSSLAFLGATVPTIRRHARDFLSRHPDLDRPALLAMVQELWQRDVHDLRMLAIDLLEARVGLLTADDMPLLEALLRTSHTWAYVDSLAASVVGGLVERDASLAATLDRWAVDEDFWVRRSAMLALLIPLRRGRGDLDRFLGYADAMLEEKEFFIRKAIGWVLRDVGRTRPEPVYRWLLPRVGRVSGLTLREAIRHLPSDQRQELLAAYQAR
jgi:3-methyladenine DNA glycosylase AlkD